MANHHNAGEIRGAVTTEEIPDGGIRDLLIKDHETGINRIENIGDFTEVIDGK
jgi:hypothetical protein